MKLKEVFSEEYLKGMKQGIKICQEIAERDGYEIYFPDLDEMEIEKDTKRRKTKLKRGFKFKR